MFTSSTSVKQKQMVNQFLVQNMSKVRYTHFIVYFRSIDSREREQGVSQSLVNPFGIDTMCLPLFVFLCLDLSLVLPFYSSGLPGIHGWVCVLSYQSQSYTSRAD